MKMFPVIFIVLFLCSCDSLARWSADVDSARIVHTKANGLWSVIRGEIGGCSVYVATNKKDNGEKGIDIDQALSRISYDSQTGTCRYNYEDQ